MKKCYILHAHKAILNCLKFNQKLDAHRKSSTTDTNLQSSLFYHWQAKVSRAQLTKLFLDWYFSVLKLILSQAWPTHGSLPVSCGSYVNNSILSCVSCKNFVPICHLERWGATYTQGATFAHIAWKRTWWLVQAHTHKCMCVSKDEMSICSCVLHVWCCSLGNTVRNVALGLGQVGHPDIIA